MRFKYLFFQFLLFIKSPLRCFKYALLVLFFLTSCNGKNDQVQKQVEVRKVFKEMPVGAETKRLLNEYKKNKNLYRFNIDNSNSLYRILKSKISYLETYLKHYISDANINLSYGGEIVKLVKKKKSERLGEIKTLLKTKREENPTQYYFALNYVLDIIDLIERNKLDHDVNSILFEKIED